uniref:Zgc:194242 n=1 Tax=Eptatretus burgeri TaxID=7764 RepID=A0A8C4RCR3_EPTBU
MSGPFQTRLLRQFSLPRLSPLGWIVKHFFQQNNRFVEQAAVNLALLEPDHQVLELGFGPGVGLKNALAKLGPHGHLYGVDPSEYMHSVASRRLASGIQTGQVKLLRGRAESLPLSDGTIDRVFHCSSYYYWTDLDKACNEIKRVMKPGAFMVTTLRMSQLQKLEENGLFKEVNWQPQLLMEALQRAHFTDVNMKKTSNKAQLNMRQFLPPLLK